MSELAVGADTGEGSFRGSTALVLALVGVVAFVAMLVLGTLAPGDEEGHRSGGGHALSYSANGFSALVELAAATGRNPTIVRSKHALRSHDLLIVTPEHGSVPLEDILDGIGESPTLIVLPKWETSSDRKHKGWVRRDALLPRFDPEGVLAPADKFKLERHPSGGAMLHTLDALPAAVRFRAPRALQTIGLVDLGTRTDDDGKEVRRTFEPLITDGKGGTMLARIDGGPLYVLADPDLLDNLGMRDLDNARAALALLDWMNAKTATGISFDVTANGFARGRSIGALVFTPPFLPMTVALGLAAALTGLHALGRFGPARRRERALAFGKRALVDNAAALVRRAGREAMVGPRYAALVRERAQAEFGVPTRLRGDALDAYLDRLGGSDRFSTVAGALARATDRRSLLDAARALHDWRRRRDG